MKKHLIILLAVLIFSSPNLYSQKEYNNWFFGSNVGVNFGATPPSTNNLGQTGTQFGTACISDSAGNLLFYTQGTTVFDKNHQIMANGTGLFGSTGVGQTALIIKKPQSNNLFYIFTTGSSPNPIHNYSIVDMNLAAGNGSVTTKNALLWNPPPFGFINTRVLVGTKHCNGIDYWVVCHELNSNVFHSYLLSASGINTTAVVSAAGGNLCCNQGMMKISPSGKKIALVNKPQTTNGEITINDFDNSTGTVLSNSIVLTGIYKYPIGIEFSPNGNLFYGSSGYAGTATSTINNTVMQWNLCAGDNQAVNASMQILSSPVTTINTVNSANGMMQIAPDGKIYIGRDSQYWLATIDYPDSLGPACHYNNESLLIYPSLSTGCLPNFVNSPLRSSPIKLPTHTVTCQTVKFNAYTSLQSLCSASGYSVLSSSWNFGDPLSGGNNVSNAFDPTHFYTSIGTYTAYFIVNYQCASDSNKIIINVVDAVPSFSVSGKTTICKGETTTLTANGAYSYSWSTSAITNSIVVSPTVNTQYTVIATNTLNACKTKLTHSLTVAKCTGIIESDQDQRLQIYPNPNDGNFTVESEDVIDIFIYNSLGELVYKKLKENGKQNIDLSLFKDGIYLVKIFSKNFNKQMKMIKTGE